MCELLCWTGPTCAAFVNLLRNPDLVSDNVVKTNFVRNRQCWGLYCLSHDEDCDDLMMLQYFWHCLRGVDLPKYEEDEENRMEVLCPRLVWTRRTSEGSDTSPWDGISQSVVSLFHLLQICTLIPFVVTSIELLLLTYGCKGMYGARYYGQVEYITVVLIGEQKLLSPSFIFFNVVQHLGYVHT